MTAPTPTSGDSGYSRFMRLDFLVAAGDSYISPQEPEQYTAFGWHFCRVTASKLESRVAATAGSCRAALGLDPSTSLRAGALGAPPPTDPSHHKRLCAPCIP